MGAEGVDPLTFERLSPSRFVSFSFPNPLSSLQIPYGDTLRFAVVDSPSFIPTSSPPAIAAILVPHGREDDWIFSTAAGNFQLLLSYTSPNLSLSRLVLIGDLPSSSASMLRPYARPNPDDYSTSLNYFKETLVPLLIALCPKAAFCNGVPSVPFLSYEDDVIRCTPVEKLVGPIVGEMLVEDVEIDTSITARDLRRRLRFKRMPNLVQSQVRLLPESSEAGVLRPVTGSLIQPYLLPMAAALSLNAPSIDEAFRSGSPPCILCLGVGGGALLTSLRSHFGFHVVGVEADDAVLSVATRHFGLAEDESLQLMTCDGIELIEGYAQERPPSRLFHAIMVDLDGQDPMNGTIAPTADFLHRTVLLGAKLALHDHGILVINIISSGEPFYKRMIKLFRKFFCELYEIQVENCENRVLVATVSPVGFVAEELKQQGHLYEKLKELGCKRFIDAIEKV